MTADPREPEPAASSVPDPIDGVEGTARTTDGLMLRTMRWRPRGEPWAAVLLVHGLGEHVGRYRHVGRAMAEAGMDVHAYDHRGFGGSAGARAYVDRWSRYHDDLQDRLRALRETAPTLPLVLYGHSLGGLIVTGYVLDAPERQPLPDLLVLSSPGFESTVPSWKFALASPLSRILPRIRWRNGFAPGSLSRDPAVEAADRADPLTTDRSSVRLATEAHREQARVRMILRRPGPLPVPTYVIHGTDDRIVPVMATERLEDRPNVMRRVYPGLRHETHNEPEGPQVVADLIAWVRSAVAPPPPRGPVSGAV